MSAEKEEELCEVLTKKPPEVEPLVTRNVAVLVPVCPEKEDGDGRKDGFSPLYRQCLGVAGPMVGVIGCGMTSGFSAVLLPQLQHANSTIPITVDQSSWIASMPVMPMAFGCLMSGWLMERWGRKLLHQVLCLPFLVGWVLLAVAPDLPALYVGRFLTGLAVGVGSPSGVVYIAEVTSPRYRGVFLAVLSLNIAVGLLITHVLGTVLDWRLAAGISAAAPIIFFLLVTAFPESPSWLASQGRPLEAREKFFWFRGRDPDSVTELELLLQKHAEERKRKEEAAENKQSWSAYIKQIIHPSFLWPFLIMNVFFFTLQFSGVNAVAFYTVTIFKLVGSGLDEYVSTVIIDLVRVIMSGVACILLKRYRQRPLAIISGIGTALSMSGLATFLALTDLDNVDPRLSWIPITCFISYIGFISIGIVPLPWVMVGEVFPASVRGLGSGCTTFLAFMAFFTVVKSGPAMLHALRAEGTFYVYAGVATAGTIFLYFMLPETKNRTLQQIEDGYKSKEKSRTAPP